MIPGAMAEVLKLIAATTPFVIMSLRSGKINLERKYRGHQFIMPLLAVIYCIPVILFIDQIAIALIKLVGFLSRIVSFIPLIGRTINRMMDNLYSTLQMGYGVQLLCNTAVMTAFCGVKHAALPIINKLWTKWRGLYELTSARFYEEKGERSVLRPQFVHLRMMFHALYYGAVVLGGVFCVLSLLFQDSEAFRFPFYPVFGIIVLGEITFFLGGLTYGEREPGEEEEPEPETVDEKDVSLREALKRTFGDRICLEQEIPASRGKERLHDWSSDAETGDDLDQVSGAYFQAVQSAGEEINPDYVAATRNLLHHKSVLIYNPFYHDMTSYLLLPVFHELLNHNSCLIVCGRMSNEEDIVSWVRNGINSITNLPKLWKIEKLDKNSSPDPDIGVLGFSSLYDLDNMQMHKEFFAKTSFVILLEPSNLMGTGQIGLRSTLQFCEAKNKEITYCILDRNIDGLVDALSHALRQSITEVIASPSPASPYSKMIWRAEGVGMQSRILPRISHYLGIGTEIAALAMHEGVDRAHWYSGSKMPLVELKWIVEQYYPAICQYIHSPREQSELDTRFKFHQSLWKADFEENAFVLVEDEFCNAFEMTRTFAARIRKKGFINILSESYMLRDYMCANHELFSNDPKVIPSIVPDYARTEHNFVIRTIMLMAVAPMDERDLSRELALHGLSTKNPYQKLCELIKLHTGIENFHIHTIREYVGIGGNKYSRFAYQADRMLTEAVFDSALKSAFYVVENERMNLYPMGNRLMGHIEQVMLPGQFFCYDGKYYQVRSISGENGIIVRRAGDHLNGRVYYRQLRDYQVKVTGTRDTARDLRGIKLDECVADICVVTDGYLELKIRNILPEGIAVRLEKARTRKLVHKEILKVTMQDATPEVRFALCVLFNELFQTVYPNESGYIVAVPGMAPESVVQDKDYQMRLRSLVPSAVCSEEDKNSIYFIEDSCIDLGLLVSIERNFQRFMEIITDYLDWYLDPKRAQKEEEEKEENLENLQNEEYWERWLANQIATTDVEGEDEELAGDSPRVTGEAPVEYLTFGYGKVPDWLKLADTLRYLNDHQFHDSNLQRSRKNPPEFDEGSNYDPNQPGTHYCDFCGRPLEKGTYDVLKDGRERCSECTKDAVKTNRQFKKVYKQTLEEMEKVYGIKIDCPIKVRMANARKVNDIPNATYVPTPQMDIRVLGYAQRGREGYKLLVENGSPLWTLKSTLVHELTHIWQFRNWKDSDVSATFKTEEERSLTYEGMAVWAEVQYLMSMDQKERAVRYKRNRDMDPSVYGVGMKKFLAAYPVREKPTVEKNKTPFGKFPPL